MKKLVFPLLLVSAFLWTPTVSTAGKLVGPPASKPAADATYKVQPQLSALGWQAQAITHGHNGSLQFAGGTLLVRGNQLVGGTITVDMKSVKALDIKDEVENAKFITHMHSDDFFSTAKFPTASFKITKVTPIAGAAADANNATITGDLTIKGITHPLTFPAKVGVKNGVAAASGTATVDRTQYNVRFGSKSFFEGIGDQAIYDDFLLGFNIVAKP
jgi:polyisoprenoid-binding protein YceI